MSGRARLARAVAATAAPGARIFQFGEVTAVNPGAVGEASVQINNGPTMRSLVAVDVGDFVVWAPNGGAPFVLGVLQ